MKLLSANAIQQLYVLDRVIEKIRTHALLTIQICSTSIILIREWKICWKN